MIRPDGSNRANGEEAASRLKARRISKSFPGVQALDRVDFTLRAGEIHALMGENGAGKSTLINVLTGALRPDEGSIELDGQPVHFRSPVDAQRHGVATVYQEVNLIPQLSVAENLMIGRQPTRFGVLRPIRGLRSARKALDLIGLDVNLHATLGALPIAIQQMVAIARAVSMSSRVLVLDEPTSSLDEAETGRLFATMRDLRSRGMGLIFITHFLDQVYDVADRTTVLRNGAHIMTAPTDALPRLDLVSHMIGRDVEGSMRRAGVRLIEHAPEGEPALRARGIGRRRVMQPIDLSIHPGEIVGLAGLLGSGRSEAARLLFGADRADSGTIEINGVQVDIHSPRDAIRAGLGFLAEDRKKDGILPELSLRDNMMVAWQARRGVARRIPSRDAASRTDALIASLSIRTTDDRKPIRALSGGNQQKALLARWLAVNPQVLILDEPMRGVDVGAKIEIERIIRTLREQSVAVLLISSEIDELVRNCDRILILRDRAMVAELAGDQATESNIMRHLAEHAT